MVFGERIKMQGFLVGIGKERKDGTTEFKFLKKPIHNTIVQNGIDTLLHKLSSWMPSYNSNVWYTVASVFSWSNMNNMANAGVLYYCGFGDGAGETDFSTQSDLNNRLSVYSNFYNGGKYPYNGTREISAGTLGMRKSHISPAVTAETIVREIGYYAGLGSGHSTKSLFSRIVLEEPFVLNEGDKLITAYELRVSLSDYEKSYGSFNILATDGTPLKYEKRRTLYKNAAGTSFGFPYVTDGGSADIDTYGKAGQCYQVGITGSPYWYAGSQSQNPGAEQNVLGYCLEDKEIPEWGAGESGCSSLTGRAGGDTVRLKPYTLGDNYREVYYTLPVLYPDLTDGESFVDIHYLNIAGVAYRFGYFENGVWIPQSLRKYGNQEIKISFRISISTPDSV